MNKVSMILSAITVGAMIVFIAPGIFALNRGHVLRNIALWLAIFCGLAVIYQNFGPGSPHPLISTPASRAGMPETAVPADKNDDAKPPDGKSSGDQGFTPPKD